MSIDSYLLLPEEKQSLSPSREDLNEWVISQDLSKEKKMKKFTLSRVLDGFRSSVNQGPGGQGPGQGSPSKNLEGPLTEIPEPLRAENFQIAQVCEFFFVCCFCLLP